MQIQERIGQAAQAYAGEMGIRLGLLPPSLGPATIDERLDYSTAKGTADRVLELGVLGIEATGFSEKKRVLVHFAVTMRARYVDVRTGKELDSWRARFTSTIAEVREWLAEDGRLVREEFERATAWLGEQAVDEALLVYRPVPKVPRTTVASPLDEPTGRIDRHERVPAYALRAIVLPTGSGAVPWDTGSSGFSGWATVASVRPTFRWEPFPRAFEDAGDGGPVDAEALRYDLRIFGQRGIVYQRIGLERPEHELEQPLEPCHRYSWTVRARFIHHGAPRVSEWTGAYAGDLYLTDPSWWRRDSKPWWGWAPDSVESMYPVIVTPQADGTACPGK
jgi:hypothetical protein